MWWREKRRVIKEGPGMAVGEVGEAGEGPFAAATDRTFSGSALHNRQLVLARINSFFMLTIVLLFFYLITVLSQYQQLINQSSFVI